MSKIQLEAAIACNRFGMGARPGDIDSAANAGPKEWLMKQLKAPLEKATNSLSAKQALVKQKQFITLRRQIRKRPNDNKGSKEADKKQLKALSPQGYFVSALADALMASVAADNSLAWRLRDFFSNHFSVTADGSTMKFLAPTLEREAIAPNVLGKFSDLLIAVESHPTMLIYLNNDKSLGPDSIIGARSKKRGLNENLAREILELHTLGVDGGYAQKDVVELALGISGWGVDRKGEAPGTGFVFNQRGHQPGARTLLGKRYPVGDVSQGQAMLADLAMAPKTAEFICTKLVRHFVSDKPSKTLVQSLVKRWLATDGDLREVMLSLINNNEAWLNEAKKYKTPREFMVSTLRAGLPKRVLPGQIINGLTELGQKPFSAGSPAGFSDLSAGWDSAVGLYSRIEWSSQYAKRLRSDAIVMAKQSLGEWLHPDTLKALTRAESQEQARVLLLMSPEFQRR